MQIGKTLLAVMRRRVSERAYYQTLGGWLASLYNRILLRLPRVALPGRNAECAVRLAGGGPPVVVRLGTSDWYVLEEMFIRREYQPAVQYLRGVRTIVDLGANVGLSIRFWRQAYPRARVLAVEPDEDNLKICQRNVGRDLGVTLVRACVGASRRPVFLDRTGAAWGYRMIDNGTGDSMEAVPVDELLAQFEPTGPIDLLKCDIEGSEAEVFAHCRNWIDRIRNLIVEVHHPYDAKRLLGDVGPDFEVYGRIDGGDREVLFLARSPTRAR